MHKRLIKRNIRIFCRRLLSLARLIFSVVKAFLTKDLLVYFEFVLKTTTEFTKNLSNGFKIEKEKFEDRHIDKIINLKRNLRKYRNKLSNKDFQKGDIKKLKNPNRGKYLRIFEEKLSCVPRNVMKTIFNLNKSLKNIRLKSDHKNHLKSKVRAAFSKISKYPHRFSYYSYQLYQVLNKTRHSQNFNKILIVVFLVLALFIVEDQLDRVKITQKVESDIQVENVKASSNSELVFKYDYELNTKTKILKYLIHPALASGENQPQLVLMDHDGKKHNPEFDIDREGETSFSVRIAQNKLPPGEYEAMLEVYKDGVYYQQDRRFTYGVLTVNTNKSIFTPGEEIIFNMGALKNDGHTICDADLELVITNPLGEESKPEINQSGACDRDNVTNIPDYSAIYKATEIGKHKMVLLNKDTSYSIEDYYEVRESVPFSIERKGPSRIYPFVPYPMETVITANQDFQGEIIEKVPKTFYIKELETAQDDEWQYVKWKADLTKGDSISYTYFFDAPDISPYLFLLGPISMGDFEESRVWQIASDADGSGAVTVTPSVVEVSSTGNTLTFTFDPSEIMDSGEVAIKVPTSRGWSTPQGSAGTAGYTTVSTSGNATIGVRIVSADSTSEGVWTLTEDDADACNTTAAPFIDTTTKFEGGGAVQCDNSSSALPDDTDSFSYTYDTGENWTNYTELSTWIRSTKALDSTNGVELAYDNNTNMSSPNLLFNAGSVSANTWTYVKGTMSGSRTAIRAVGLVSNGNGFDNAIIWMDEIMLGTTVPEFVANGSDTDIRFRLIDLAASETVTVTYGSGGGSSGASAPSSGGVDEFTTRTRTNASGTLTNISDHPDVNVLAPVDISGTCKQDNQSTNCTDTGTIRVAFNGVLQAQTQATVAGTWSVLDLEQPASGTVITVFIDGAGDADEAVAVTTYDGSGDVSGIELIEQRLTIGNSDNRTITNANLASYDNSVSGDEDIFFDIDGSNNLTMTETGKTLTELYIKSGNTLNMNGNVTVNDLEVVGTLQVNNYTVNVSGDGTPFALSGTLNEGTGSFRYSSTSSVNITTETYNHLLLQPSGAGSPTYSLSSGTLNTNNLTVGDGTNTVTLNWNTSDPTLNIGGNLLLNSGSTWTKSDTATLTFNGAATPVTLTDNNSTKQDLGKIKIDGPKEVDIGSSISVERIEVTSGDTLDLQSSGYNLKITGSGTSTSKPFIVNGSLSEGTNSTVEFIGSSATEVSSETYHHLSLNKSGTTFTASGTLNITGVFTINSGTFNAGSNTINLNGGGTPFVVNGDFASQSSTISYRGTSATNILSIEYYNLVVGNINLASSVTYTSQVGTIDVLGYFSLGFTSGSEAIFDADTNNTAINVTGIFSIDAISARFEASSNSASPLTLLNNFLNYDGVFYHNGGKVIMGSGVDSTQRISGSNSFYDLEITGGDRVFTFAQNTNTVIDNNGSLNLTGSNCENLLRVRTMLAGNQATLDVSLSATVTASHLDIQDINLTTKSVTASNSVNSGNNSANWTISPNACIGTSTNQNTTGSSFQRKVIYDDQNLRYWSFNHDGDEIEIKYSDDEGSTWTNPATAASGRLPYDTNDFSVWWKSISSVEYIVVAVADGGDIKVRQGTLGGTDITWDTDVSVALNETGTYSNPYITLDSSNKLWIGATYVDGTDYVYKTTVSAQAISIDPSTWTWSETPYQISNPDTSSNVYGTVTALSNEDMYATFVVNTELLGCRWDDSDNMWEDASGESCVSTAGSTGESSYFNSLETDLVGYWKMNEASWNGTSGQILDESSNENDGTSSGNATTITSGFGRAGSFDGSGDYATIPSGFQIPSQTGTVSAWVYPVETGGSYDILSSGTSSNDFRFAPVNNVYGFYISSEYRVSYATDPVANAWTMVTLTWDQTNGSILYFNGKQVASNSNPPPAYTQTGLKIASNPDGGGDYLEGRVDDVRAYNRALSSEDVAKLYQLQPESVIIDDASNYGSMLGAGNQVVRTKSGVLYSLEHNENSIKAYKSTDGINWTNPISFVIYCDALCIEVAAEIRSDDDIAIVYSEFDDLTDNVYTLKYSVLDTGLDVFGTSTLIRSVSLATPIGAASLVIDSADKAHVVWTEGSNLYYSNNVSANFTSLVTVEALGTAYVDIAIDMDNRPQIAYVNHTDDDLTLRRGNANNATEFTTSVYDVDTDINDNSTQQGVNIAIDTSTGNTWVVYIDDSSADDNIANDAVTLAKHNYSDGWTTWSTVTSKTDVGSEPFISITGSSDIYIFYENDTDDISYDVYDSVAAEWAGETVLHTGTFQDVKVKSSFEWNNYGTNKIDYLYSDGTDVYYDSMYLRRSPTNIDDASDFGTVLGSGRNIVRTSSGVLYSVVEDGGVCEVWESTDNGYNWFIQDSANDPACATTISPAIAIDSTDTIYMVYRDDVVVNSLYYVTFSTTTGLFSAESLLMGGTGSQKLSVDISIDSNDKPHVVFTQSVVGEYYQVVYSNLVTTTWTGVTVETTSSYGVTVSRAVISISDEDIPEISYIHMGDSDLTAAVGNQNNANSFTLQDVDNDVNITSNIMGVSLGIDSSGNTWISYVDSDGYLNLAKHLDASAWSSWETLIETSQTALEPSLAISGTDVYVFYQDDQDDIVFDMYDGSAWSGETILEMHGALQHVKARWSYINNYDSTGIAPVQTNTYYFDGSDAAATDPDNVWTNETNADDGSTTTYASTTQGGSENSYEIRMEGTNAPSSGGTIVSVKARLHNGTTWGNYGTVAAPVAGWSWSAIQALELQLIYIPFFDATSTQIYEDNDNGGEILLAVEVADVGTEGRISKVEILVESTNDTPQSEIDYLYSDGTDVFYNRLVLGEGIIPGIQDSIVTGLSTGLNKNISTVGQTISSTDYVHLSYINSSGNIYYDRYDGDWDFTNASLDANSDNTYLGMSKDTATNDVYLGYIGSSSDDIFMKKVTYSAGPNWSWGSSSTLVTDASEIYTNYNANYSGGSRIGSIYSIGDLSPYNIGWEVVLTGSTNNDPTVGDVEVNESEDISLTAGSTHNVSWTGTITDLDGYSEISGVTGKLYRSGVSGADECTPDNNNCYEDTSCDLSECSGNICTATCTVGMYFHADATDINSSMPSEYWRGWIEATDSYSAVGSEYSPINSPDVESLEALGVDSSMDFGILLAGDSSIEKTTLITNRGNITIDLELAGDNLCTDYPTCSGSLIPVGQQEYSMTTFSYGSGSDLSGTITRIQFNLAKGTESPSNSTKNLYWRLGLGSEQAVGVYEGENQIYSKNDNSP